MPEAVTDTRLGGGYRSGVTGSEQAGRPTAATGADGADPTRARFPVYPMGLLLRGRRVVVVGAGVVALRRVAALLLAEADVVVVAPEATAVLADLAATGRVRWRPRGYVDQDLADAWLVLACTNDPAVNARVAAQAERLRIFCTRADNAQAATAWVPAVGRAGAVTVAVHADRDPRRAAALRDRLVEHARTEPGPPQRPVARPGAGRVILVGGGPGDPGLITVRGRAALALADVVVTDRLAPLVLLDELAPHVLVIDAAKVPGGHSMAQEEINRHLVEHARAGKTVVRLKGGDPFVFGRGMEEVQACLAAGLSVDVVPGVTSAVALPGLAGIPVTHRGVVQAFTVVSGHVPPGDPRSTVDWKALAAVGATLVVLMGVATMPAIAEALLAGGLPATTPVAAATDGAAATVSTLGQVAAGEGLTAVAAPAVFVIGDVVPLPTVPG
jgi:uroporphyrin-III C-methyltransferase / precorrin-2 dehydrogenase / sirohydrochlorin ferrochelatase